MSFVYVLKLEKRKYYVGITKTPDKRIADHFENNGSSWTKKYKPIDVVEVIPNCDNYDEDKYTRKYMDKYGIDNVRGGSYTTIQLDENTKNHIEREKRSCQNKCFKCGKTGHYANMCDVSDEESDDDSEVSDSENEYENNRYYKKNNYYYSENDSDDGYDSYDSDDSYDSYG